MEPTPSSVRSYLAPASGCGVTNVLGEHEAVSEMKGGSSEPACRRRLQTAVSCCRQKLRWWTLRCTGVGHHVMYGWERRAHAHHCGSIATDRLVPAQPAPPPCSGSRLAATAFVAMGCPVGRGVPLRWARVRNERTGAAVGRAKAPAAAPRGRTSWSGGQGRPPSEERWSGGRPVEPRRGPCVSWPVGHLETGGAGWSWRQAAACGAWHAQCDWRPSGTVLWEPRGAMPRGYAARRVTGVPTVAAA